MNIAAGALTHVAYCWLVERRDGFGLALTSHDHALDIVGTRYSPAPGIEPKSLRFAEGLEPDDSEVTGSLTSDAICASDLENGLWDGARARLFAVDWSNPAGPHIDLFAGELGNIRTQGGEFAAEVTGSAARLDEAACPSTSPLCRARLGDRECRVDLAGRSKRAIVVAQSGSTLELDQPIGQDFTFGSLRIVSRAARGFRSVVLDVSGALVTLRDMPPKSIETGTFVLLGEGCDKRFSTCASRFENAANFRGEPHLPGSDLLTRYPGT